MLRVERPALRERGEEVVGRLRREREAFLALVTKRLEQPERSVADGFRAELLQRGDDGLLGLEFVHAF